MWLVRIHKEKIKERKGSHIASLSLKIKLFQKFQELQHRTAFPVTEN